MKLHFITLIGFVASTVWAADFKMGYVDLQKALQTTEAGKTAKTNLQKEFEKKKSEFEKQQKDLQKEAEQFEKKSAILNDSARAAKQAELQKKVMEFQRAASESQMKLQERERELTKPILEELRAIIESLAKERKLQLVIEKNEGAVLYAESGSDLTEEVITRFNSKKKKS